MNRAKLVLKFPISLLLWLAIFNAYASDWEYSGNIKLLSNATLFKENDIATLNDKKLQYSTSIATRLMTNYQKRAFSFELHYDLISQYSTYNSDISNTFDDQYIDLDKSIYENNNFLLKNRIDRLILSYVDKSWVFHMGRQAISWGNGFLFNPFDFFNPFSQTAIDKDYKSGSDMLYVQWLAPNGDDIQWVFVPRKSPASDKVINRDSTVAVKYKRFLPSVEVDVIAAHHYDDPLLGLGILKSIAETIWRLDTTLLFLDDEKTEFTLMSNVDYSWTWIDYNMYGYLEFFYNSMGISSYDDFDGSQIADRIQRAELFTVGRSYLATGLTIETSPLTNMSSNIIVNIGDGSVLIPLSYNYSWKQNTNITIGATLGFGKRDTEYGGYQVNGLYLGNGQSTYILISNYF